MNWDRDKAISAILYVCERLDARSLTPDTICAILYRADKLHLGKSYIRTICNDNYEATIDGTRPLRTYKLMTDPQWLRGVEEFFEINDEGRIAARRPPDLMKFSRSDQECLAAAIAAFHAYGRLEIEGWRKDWAWEVVTCHGAIFRDDPGPCPLSQLGVALTLPNAMTVIRRLYDQGGIR